jgi:hypothetical protein
VSPWAPEAGADLWRAHSPATPATSSPCVGRDGPPAIGAFHSQVGVVSSGAPCSPWSYVRGQRRNSAGLGMDQGKQRRALAPPSPAQLDAAPPTPLPPCSDDASGTGVGWCFPTTRSLAPASPLLALARSRRVPSPRLRALRGSRARLRARERDRAKQATKNRTCLQGDHVVAVLDGARPVG